MLLVASCYRNGDKIRYHLLIRPDGPLGSRYADFTQSKCLIVQGKLWLKGKWNFLEERRSNKANGLTWHSSYAFQRLQIWARVTWCYKSNGNIANQIDLFRLYIEFFQCRSCDDTQGIWSFVLFIIKNKCKHEYALFNEQDKGSNLLSIITWSLLGKQNVQAKKVYSRIHNRLR